MRKSRIMAPGPTELPPAVQAAGSLPMIHHRSLEFRQLFGDVCEKVKPIFQTTQPVLVLNAGGTGGMEACITNLSDPEDTLLAITGGVFGERWAKIGEQLGRKVIRLEVPWGEAVQPERIAELLAKFPHTTLVLGTLCETSTGIEHPIKEIAKIVSQTPALFVVDAISSLGASEFKMDEWRVDAAVAGTQKGLMCPPGLALVALSERAQITLKNKRGPKFYWSFETALHHLLSEPYPDTPWTPNITLIFQLQKALDLLLEEGLENVWKRHQLLAGAARAGVKGMGLIVYNERSPSPVVTVIQSPEGLESSVIKKNLQNEWGITLVMGQGKLKQEVFRIGHVGYCDRTDVLMTIAALEAVLADLQVPIILGRGVAASQEFFINAKPRELHV